MKTKYWILIGLLVVGGIFLLKKEAIGGNRYDTLAECEAGRTFYLGQSVPCVPSCVALTTSSAACVNTCLNLAFVSAGQYYLQIDDSRTCCESYQQSSLSKCTYDCMYGGSPQQPCGTCTPSCPTASTVCDGMDAGSDGCGGRCIGTKSCTCQVGGAFVCSNGDSYWVVPGTATPCQLREECGTRTCEYGACVGTTTCNTDADTDCNGVVSRTELGVMAQSWINSGGSDSIRITLGQAAQAWISAGGLE